MTPLAALEDMLAQPLEVGEDDEAEFEVYLEPVGEGASPGAFDEVVAAVAEGWGPPVFRAKAGEADFPAWAEGSLALAYWRRGGRLAYARLEQPDPALAPSVAVGVVSEG